MPGDDPVLNLGGPGAAQAVAALGQSAQASLARARKYQQAPVPRFGDQSTVLLLHCDGADGATTFLDSSLYAHPITVFGNSQIDTAQSVFGGSSALFDGAGDNLISPDSPDWAFGSGDFTIDFWIRFNTVGTDVVLIGQGAAPQMSWYIRKNAVNSWYMAFSQDGTVVTNSQTYSYTPTAGVWYHIAWVRSGANLMFFVNGVQQGATAAMPYATLFDSTGPLSVSHATLSLDGWMDEVRISKGIARWTSNFTPPTVPY